MSRQEVWEGLAYTHTPESAMGIADLICKEGRSGWEPVAVIPAQGLSLTYIFVFKRRVLPNSAPPPLPTNPYEPLEHLDEPPPETQDRSLLDPGFARKPARPLDDGVLRASLERHLPGG